MPLFPFTAVSRRISGCGDDLLDQLQVRRVVLDIEQGVQLPSHAGRPDRRIAGFLIRKQWLGNPTSARTRTHCPPRPALHAIAPPISSTSRFGDHQTDTRAFLATTLLAQPVEGLKELS